MTTEEEDHPLAGAPPPPASSSPPVELFMADEVTTMGRTESSGAASAEGGASTTATSAASASARNTASALADALPQGQPPRPPAAAPLPPRYPAPGKQHNSLPWSAASSKVATAAVTGRSSSVVVLAASGPFARGEAAIVVTPAALSSTASPPSSTSPLPREQATTTLLATIDPLTGKILHDPAHGVGTFSSEEEALRALRDIWGGREAATASPSPPHPPYRVLSRGVALLGYLRGGPRSGRGRAVLVASAARPSARLPGGHLVRSVTSSEWVPLPSPPPVERLGEGGEDDSVEGRRNGSSGGSRNGDGDGGENDDDRDDGDAALSSLAETAARFRLDGAHYYCETADVTRPFPGRKGLSSRRRRFLRRPSPSSSPDDGEDGDGGEQRVDDGDDGEEPSWEFVWNAAVAAPLRAAGLGPAVPHLLQGVAESRPVALLREENGKTRRKGEKQGEETTSTTTSTMARATPVTLVLLTRSSRLHAGTRYRARGLNALASPGNEVEVEQLMWCDDDDEEEEGEEGGDESGGETGERDAARQPLPSRPSPSPRRPSISFSSSVWRRGTVPLWWGVEIRGGGVGEAAIVVAGSCAAGASAAAANASASGREQQRDGSPSSGHGDPYEGTRRYFRRLQRRFAWPDEGVAAGERVGEGRGERVGEGVGGEVGGGGDPSVSVPVYCVNLLRCSMSRHDELLLSEHFAEGIRRAKVCRGRGAWESGRASAATKARTANEEVAPSPSPSPLPLQCLNFDWHGVIKELGEPGAVDGLWASLSPLLEKIGLTSGKLVSTDAPGEGGGRPPPPARRVARWPGYEARIESRQRGLLRYNCADSLDRTNAASYFGGVLSLAEQCHALRLRGRAPSHLSCSSASPGTSQQESVASRGRGGASAGSFPSPLPPRPPTQPTTVPLPSLGPLLPAGWGAFLYVPTGRVGFLDHERRETTWVAPEGVDVDAVEAAAASAAAEESTAAAAAAASSMVSPSSALAPVAAAPPRPQTLPRAAALAAAGVSGISSLSSSSRRSTTTTPSAAASSTAAAPTSPSPLPRSLLSPHAEAFRIAGDVHAHLYTASPAMHSGILGMLLVDDGGGEEGGGGAAAAASGESQSDESGADTDGGDGGSDGASGDEGGGAGASSALAPFSRKQKQKTENKKKSGSRSSSSSSTLPLLERAARAGVGKLRNATLSVQRRWANLTADAGRQAATEAFLGIRPVAVSAGGSSAASAPSLEARLPPLYLCEGAEVPPEHETDDEGGGGRDEGNPTKQEEGEVATGPWTAPPAPSRDRRVDSLGEALAESSIGGGGAGDAREKLHPLDM